MKEYGESLTRFTDIVEKIPSSLTQEQLIEIQSQAEMLQSEMERYFSERQNLGAIWQNEPAIETGGHISAAIAIFL